MQEPINPYAPPTAAGPSPAGWRSGEDPAQLEQIRRDCIKREANIKSIGFLFGLGAFGTGLAALAMGGMVLGGDLGFGLLMLVIVGGLATLYGFIAVWLRRLDPKGRIGATILISLSLAGGAFSNIIEAMRSGSAYAAGRMTGGLVIPIIVLSLMWTKPAATIFSEHYRNVVVPATPHVKYTSVLALVLLGVLLLGLVTAAFAALTT